MSPQAKEWLLWVGWAVWWVIVTLAWLWVWVPVR